MSLIYRLPGEQLSETNSGEQLSEPDQYSPFEKNYPFLSRRERKIFGRTSLVGCADEFGSIFFIVMSLIV
jgi:hypothetical protein